MSTGEGGVSRDWHVFPVGRDKVPWVRWKTEEPAQPREQWVGWPEGANVGIDCGRSGLVVIDEDRPGAVREWLGYEPETHTVSTGRGRHFYFLADSARVGNRAEVAEGVDVRGDGGFVVGAGSVHANGTTYQVENDVEPVPLPDDLRELLDGRQSAAERLDGLPTVDLAHQPFALPDRILEGTRNDTLHRYASSLAGRGQPDGEALVLLREAWSRCDPPYTDTTPERMWERVRREYLANRDRDHERRSREEYDRLRAREQAKVWLAEEQAAETAAAWFGVTGDQWDPDAPRPRPSVLEYALGRFALSAGVSSVFGERSSAKTWLCYQAVAQEVLRGRPALIVDYEMSYDEAMGRLNELGVDDDETRRRVVYLRPPGPFADAGRAVLASRFTEPPSVVVIDSVGVAMGQGASGLNSNDDTDVATWAAQVPLWMKEQWPQAAILLIDHVPKGSTGVVNDPIGSQRKGAMADYLFSVQKLSPISRATRGSGRMTVTKDRSGWSEEGQAVLDFHFGGGGPFELAEANQGVAVVDLSGVGDDQQTMRRIAEHVGENEGQTVEQVRDALAVHPNEFTRLKKQLVADEVVRHERGRGLFKGESWGQYVADCLVGTEVG